MKDVVGNEITLGCTVRWGNVWENKEGRVIAITQKFHKKYRWTEKVLDRWVEVPVTRLRVKRGCSIISLKPERVLLVTNEARPAD